MHAADAAAIGVAAAELVRLGDQGIFRVLISDKVAPGNLFAPLHWTRQTSASGVVNKAVQVGNDPFSGQPALKSAQVTATRFDAKWYGFAVSEVRTAPHYPYHAIARTQTGWQAEFAGRKAPVDWEIAARRVTGCDSGDAAVMTDAATGQTRVAIIAEGIVTALFFASREPVVVARAHAASLIGSNVSSLAALAGRGAADRPDPGATVCACYNVGVSTLRAAIKDGAQTVGALGEATCAGTNCGSCKPELAALIAAAPLPMAAE